MAHIDAGDVEPRSSRTRSAIARSRSVDTVRESKVTRLNDIGRVIAKRSAVALLRNEASQPVAEASTSAVVLATYDERIGEGSVGESLEASVGGRFASLGDGGFDLRVASDVEFLNDL